MEWTHRQAPADVAAWDRWESLKKGEAGAKELAEFKNFKPTLVAELPKPRETKLLERGDITCPRVSHCNRACFL